MECFLVVAFDAYGYQGPMYRSWLLGLTLLTSVACGIIVTHETDVAAPQNYRPPNAADQWLIEGELDSEIHRDKFTDFQKVAARTLTLKINGEKAIEAPVPTDEQGYTNGTVDGTYRGAKLHVDCSSQKKTNNWIEIRCRVIVNNEIAVTLVM
jgi:hypothetical protein